MNAPSLQFALQVEATYSGHSHVKHYASRDIWTRGAHEVLRRGECPHTKADRANEAAEPFANAGVVTDDVHCRQLCFGHLRVPAEVRAKNGRWFHTLRLQWPATSRHALL
ncbi:MAG: hypothetical protein QOJ99_2785 [Bryobacterales bacterium]|nr:hypothetical protein [Bryobacterales bacterium]